LESVRKILKFEFKFGQFELNSETLKNSLNLPCSEPFLAMLKVEYEEVPERNSV
jgi:hypothetical protein